MKIAHVKNGHAMRGVQLTAPALASFGNEPQRNHTLGRADVQSSPDLFQQVSESATSLIDALNQTPPRILDQQQKELVRGNAERLLQVLMEFLNLYGSVGSGRRDKIVGRTETNQADAQFLHRAIGVAEKHMSDFEFGTETMARELAVSRRQLFRKFKMMAGCTPNVFVRTLRLNRAAELLNKSRMTITDITHAVGFSDLKYFRAIFRKQFGGLPKEYPRPSNRQGPGKRSDAVTNSRNPLVAYHGGSVVRMTPPKLWENELVTGISF
jgi:AraC-like DNA-binding protein